MPDDLFELFDQGLLLLYLSFCLFNALLFLCNLRLELSEDGQLVG